MVHDQDWPCSALGLAGDQGQIVSTRGRAVALLLGRQ